MSPRSQHSSLIAISKASLFKPVLVSKAAWFKLQNRKLPNRFIHEQVPYFAQWKSRRLVAHILDGSVQAEDDPKWKASGATSKAEYASWSWSACGMACLKMILAHRNNSVIPLVTLGKKSLVYGCYDKPLETSVGLKYTPFVDFLAQEFNIAAKAAPVLPCDQIVNELAHGNYVMASVNSLIRNPSSKPVGKGGHLVLVLGYNLDRREFYLHNPSGGIAASESYAAVSFQDFTKFFSNKGIVVSGKETNLTSTQASRSSP